MSAELAKQLAEHTKHDVAKKKSSKKAAPPLEASPEAPATPETAANSDLDPNASLEDLNQAYEDAETDAAVDDIVKEEADELIAHEDAAREPTPDKPRGFWGKIGHFFAAWWRNKWARWITILIVLAGIAAVAVFPQSRYLTLNTLGVRSSASLRVVDVATQLPLKNVRVTMAGQSLITDEKGLVTFRGLTLGPHTLEIKRIAFSSVKQQLTIGWGSNPLGTYRLNATGIKYLIYTHDYLSDKGVGSASAESGQASAVADSKGIITLVLDEEQATTAAELTVTANGYRTEHLTVDLQNTESTPLVLVPATPAIFVSKQSGRYDVVRSDIDGKNRKVILPGTGSENNNITLAVDDQGKRAALVSTRDSVRDSDGYLLSTLTLIDIDSGSTVVLDHAEQIQLIDWSGTRIIYEQAVAGASASNSQRYRLISYDYVANNRVQLATANQFNAVISAQDMIYYGTSSTDPAIKASFMRVRPDGSSRQTILSQETWSAFRTAFNSLALQTPTGWFTYDMSAGQSQKAEAPSVFQSRLYADAGSRHAYVDARDGQSVILAYDATTGKETAVHQQAGLGYPLRWLNATTLTYRVATDQEVADYAVSIEGGQAKKISDVSNSYGFAQTN